MRREIEMRREIDEKRDRDEMTNATVLCGNLDPTPMRWKNGQVHTTAL